MDWLNYHHLHYFWAVVREGGLVAAGKKLRVSHPTLSAQVHALEDALGEKLLVKSGRRLVLTEMGKVVHRYADEIFSLGRELVDVVQERVVGQRVRFDVGVVDVVPKMVVRRLLRPALALPDPVRLVCYEERFDKLLADLAQHTLDIVISDSPVPPGSAVRAYNHLLGETGVSLYAKEGLAARYRENFPRSLHGAPMLLPLENLPLRRLLNQWFERHEITPHVVGEFEDSALMQSFGGDEAGIFPAPTVMYESIARQYAAVELGPADGVHERFYAISVDRRLQHPAVLAISRAARHDFLS